MQKWINTNKKELIGSYEEYLKDILVYFDDEIESVLNFKDFCKFQKDYFENNYKSIKESGLNVL